MRLRFGLTAVWVAFLLHAGPAYGKGWGKAEKKLLESAATEAQTLLLASKEGAQWCNQERSAVIQSRSRSLKEYGALGDKMREEEKLRYKKTRAQFSELRRRLGLCRATASLRTAALGSLSLRERDPLGAGKTLQEALEAWQKAGGEQLEVAVANSCNLVAQTLLAMALPIDWQVIRYSTWRKRVQQAGRLKLCPHYDRQAIVVAEATLEVVRVLQSTSGPHVPASESAAAVEDLLSHWPQGSLISISEVKKAGTDLSKMVLRRAGEAVAAVEKSPSFKSIEQASQQLASARAGLGRSKEIRSLEVRLDRAESTLVKKRRDALGAMNSEEVVNKHRRLALELEKQVSTRSGRHVMDVWKREMDVAQQRLVARRNERIARVMGPVQVKLVGQSFQHGVQPGLSASERDRGMNVEQSRSKAEEIALKLRNELGFKNVILTLKGGDSSTMNGKKNQLLSVEVELTQCIVEKLWRPQDLARRARGGVGPIWDAMFLTQFVYPLHQSFDAVLLRIQIRNHNGRRFVMEKSGNKPIAAKLDGDFLNPGGDERTSAAQQAEVVKFLGFPYPCFKEN